MIIKRHYHVEDTLQRSVVESSGRTLRRIARYVTAEGELTDQIPSHGPVWQERQNSGEFHNVTPETAAKFERKFIEALIEANRQLS